jgi:hypothetical protein
MEGSADREQKGAPGTGRFGKLHGAFDGARVAGNNNLIDRVEVGGRDDFALGRVLQNLLEFAAGQFEQSGHGAYAFRHGILHELAAGADEPEGVGKIEAADGNQGGVFSEAVAGHNARAMVEFSKDAVSGNRSSENGGLGIGSLLKFFLRAVETKIREREAESSIGFRESPACNWKFSGQTLAHAGELRALAWEKESEI